MNQPLQLPELTPGQALWRGAVTALVVVLPVAMLNNLVAGDDDGSPVLYVFFALILLGGAAGGWAVIRLSAAAPLSYAAAAAALSYVAAQGLGVVLRLARGDDINWAGYPFAAILMATCGMLGGMLARRWQQQQGADMSGDGPGGTRP